MTDNESDQCTDIAEVNVYVVDLRTNFDVAVAACKRYFDVAVAACKRYFGEHRPANNLLGVEALALPQQ